MMQRRRTFATNAQSASDSELVPSNKNGVFGDRRLKHADLSFVFKRLLASTQLDHDLFHLQGEGRQGYGRCALQGPVL